MITTMNNKTKIKNVKEFDYELLDTGAVEKWAYSGKWVDYKKKLKTEYENKYPDYDIKIVKHIGRGGSGKGFNDYMVLGFARKVGK